MWHNHDSQQMMLVRDDSMIDRLILVILGKSLRQEKTHDATYESPQFHSLGKPDIYI